MEGTPRPNHYTSWIFSFDWPVAVEMEIHLMRALEQGFLNWVVIPLTGITPAVLQEETHTLSMEMQDS